MLNLKRNQMGYQQ